MNPTVFLGLVTHRATRFPESQGETGLLAQIHQELQTRGVSSVVSVHDADHFDAALVPLTKAEVTASIVAELDLEQRWRIYVRPEKAGIPLTAFMGLRRLYRRIRLAPPWSSDAEASAPGAAMLRRLVNIELAHLHLMNQAMEQGAEWALIVEDDAQSSDPRAFADALADFISTHGSARQPRYVNVSRSFETDPLGIERHLTPDGEWDAGTRILRADQPLTNTVCAILYRTDFLRELMPALESIPLSPVLPIDWKLNAALLDLNQRGSLGAGDCWFLDPGPLAQGSMHAPGFD